MEPRYLDHDGDLELLAKTFEDSDPDPPLWLNSGCGHLGRKLMGFKLNYSYWAFLDLGGDGGHDLLVASLAPPENIYSIRQLGCPEFLPVALRGT